jgi:ribonucleotide reductase alpha subunit
MNKNTTTEMLKLEPHIENILKERYYLKNETSWEQMAKRLSCLYPKMYNYILQRRFIPSTPTLMNLNTNRERAGTLSSCFILGIEDSIEGIMDSMKEAAFVTKAAGGVGYNFSNLRGSNENVKTISANSGGVMAFIQIFDSVLDGVRQGGRRRGAGMSLLSIYHPDILKFIDAKTSDTSKYTRSNFSVNPDSSFYDTLKMTPHKVFRTRNVVDKKENDLVDSNGLVYTYKMLWDKIIHNAWSSAEPGIFNGDIAADRCSCKHITRNVFCNPCCFASSIPVMVKTDCGDIEIKEVTANHKVWAGDDWKTTSGYFSAGISDVYKVIFDTGYNPIYITMNHKLMTSSGKMKMLSQLKVGDTIKSMFRDPEIMSIEKYSTEEVGCITVPETGNFMLSAGIYSGNSEYTHIPYTSCNLSSFNVASFVKGGEFDWSEFESAVEDAVVYMNGVIDKNDYPIEKIRKETLAVRPIGMGVMGMAHLLYLLSIPYDSVEACNTIEKLLKFQTLVATRKSMEMARDTGKVYEYYDYDTFMDANSRFFTSDSFMSVDIAKLKMDIKKYGMYNSCLTSIAPTGTISYIADCSGGIEPVFGLVFTRKIEKENKTYEKVYLVDSIFKKYVETTYPDKSSKIYEYVANNNGSCQGCELLTKKEQSTFKVSGDISPDWHLKTLAASANNINLSVSKTINLPKNCSEKEIGEVFLKAHELGIIGVTVYRDGSREGVLVHNDNTSNVLPEHIERQHAPKRPTDLPCDIHEMNVMTDGKKERFVALVGKLAGTVYEIFVTKDNNNKLDFNKHKTGIIRKVKKGRYDLIIVNGEEKIYIEDMSKTFGGKMGTLSRLVSMSLRHGCPLQIVTIQLAKGIDGSMLDFERCVARVLKHYINDGERVITSETCPECGKKLVYIEGCKTCSDRCGWSKCG